MAVTMARAVAAVALVLCPLSGAQTTSGVVYTSEYEFAGGSDNSDSNGNCNPSTSQLTQLMKIAKLQQDAIEAHEAEMVGYEQAFAAIGNSTVAGRRRMLTVSVVPDYANAIMDAERDGFKGLSDHEIVADPEAAALAQQFAVTTGDQLGLSKSAIRVQRITAGPRKLKVEEDGVLREKVALTIQYTTR